MQIIKSSLMLALSLACLPALADCDDTRNSCNSSCNATATTGFIAGMAGALGRNDAMYNQGQRQMQDSQACYSRCQSQFNACSAQQAQQQQQEAARQQAQRQQQEAQRQAQLQRDALKKRANRVIHPPQLPRPVIKNASGILAQAAAYTAAGKPDQARMLYELVQDSAAPAAQRAQAEQQLDRFEQRNLAERNIASVPDGKLFSVDMIQLLDGAPQLTPERNLRRPLDVREVRVHMGSSGEVENDIRDIYRWQAGYLVNNRDVTANLMIDGQREPRQNSLRRIYALNGLILLSVNQTTNNYIQVISNIGDFSGKLFPVRKGGTFGWHEQRVRDEKIVDDTSWQCTWTAPVKPQEYGLDGSDKAWRMDCHGAIAPQGERSKVLIYSGKYGVFLELTIPGQSNVRRKLLSIRSS